MKTRAAVTIVIFVLAVLIIEGSCATTTQTEREHSLVVQRKIELQDSKSNIYWLTYEWMEKTLIDSDEGIQYQNEKKGVIVGRGVIRQQSRYDNVVYDFLYELTVEIKDNNARTTIESPYGKGEIEKNIIILIEPHLMPREDYEELKAKFDSVIEDLFSFIKKGSIAFEYVEEKTISASKIPPEFFAYTDHTDVQIEIHSSIYERPYVPARVTYVMTDSSIIDETVTNIKDFFIHGSDPQSLFGGEVLCGPYLTDYLSKNETFKRLEYKPIMVMFDNALLEERGFRTEKSVSAFAHYLRNALNTEGGFFIRKPTAAELDWYWTIISYDIEEPVFVLESPSHLVFLDFYDGEVLFADDFINLDWRP